MMGSTGSARRTHAGRAGLVQLANLAAYTLVQAMTCQFIVSTSAAHQTLQRCLRRAER